MFKGWENVLMTLLGIESLRIGPNRYIEQIFTDMSNGGFIQLENPKERNEQNN